MNDSVKVLVSASDDDLDPMMFDDASGDTIDIAERAEPCAKTPQPGRTRRDLERLMEERALEKELNSWW